MGVRRASRAGLDGIVERNPGGPISAPYSSDGYNGIFNTLGRLIGDGTYYNPAQEGVAGAFATAKPIPASAVSVSVSQSDNLDGTRLAYRALDGSVVSNGSTAVGGESHTGQATNRWWRVDFINRRFIATRLGQRTRADGGLSLTSYVWQGSEDGSSWTTLVTATGVGTAGSTWYTHACTDPTPWRYVRIFQAANNWLVLGDVEMWGLLL